MAHIVSCMLEGSKEAFDSSLNHYIAKAVTPQASNDSLSEKSSTVTQGSEKPFTWRMHQPERKYQLFPKDRQPAPAPAPAKNLDPGQAFALAMGQTADKTDKPSTASGLRVRIKEHNLNRRRKVSVPELGPMTTVQEVAMDSPTIPGRPPLHERSISAPGTSWKPHNLSDYITFSSSQTPDEKAELDALGMSNTGDGFRPTAGLNLPLSPKSLSPLVIPSTSSPSPSSMNRLRSGSTPAEPPLRSARTEDSPKARTPFTPMSAASGPAAITVAGMTTPKSANPSTLAMSALPTPISAPVESRSSPKPWDRPANYAAVPASAAAREESSTPTPRAEPEPSIAPALGHRRNRSESASVMERGRPRKRSETAGAAVQKRTSSKRSTSAERRAFEQLPRGWKACEAVTMFSQTETAAIQKQALQQASRFEVLRKDDVDNLSRELRHLDERTEYLRRTYTSLRAGRRNLHSRICQYLRSPRTAKFSHESILKQEEALAELDASIDDWVTKLEQAENRRTRVRQKLLEHVAAAATLPISQGVVGSSESLQQAMGIRPPPSSAAAAAGTGNISTPPRSPTKPAFSTSHTQSSSPSPQRVVAQVPSTILEQPLFEEAAASERARQEANAAPIRRAETIRIYADNDVYALLADVENQITKMSVGDPCKELPCKELPCRGPPLSDSERKEVHRARSHELLHGSPLKSSSTVDSQQQQTTAEDVLLTNAVFRPERSAVIY